MKSPTIKEKIILHLSRYPYIRFGKGSVPYSLTQYGIAENIGVSRNYVAVVLGRMKKNFIFSEMRYVEGISKKRRVYFLTKEGLKKAKNILEKWKNEKVRIVVGKNKITAPLSDIEKYMRRRDSIIEGIILMDRNGRINLNRIKIKSLKEIFVGRDKYLRYFNDLLLQIKNGKDGCLLIKGPPGIGKTSLGMKFREISTSKGFIFLQSKGYENLSMPYLPLMEIFRSGELHEYGRKIMKIMKKVINLPQKEERASSYIRHAIWYDLADEIDKLSRIKPLVIFIDDIQWVDETSLKLLYYLCVHLQNSPFLIISAWRAETKKNDLFEDIKRNMEKEGILNIISLEPLNVNEIRKMLSIMIDENIPQDFVKMVSEITGSNPFFIKAIVRKMIDDGIIVPEGRKYPVKMEGIKIPKSVKSIIMESLKNLDEKSRIVLQISSVIGEKIPYNLLKETTAMDDMQLLPILDKLIQEGLIDESPDGDVFIFTHPLLRLVIYGDIKDSMRRIYHGIIAENIEKMLERGEKIDEEINVGYHYEKSGDLERAWKYYYETAMKAKSLYAYEDFADMLERALSIINRMNRNLKDKKKEILGELGKIYALEGKYEKAIEKYVEELEITDDVEERQGIHGRIASIYREMGEFEKALEYVDNALSLTQETSLSMVKLIHEKIWILMRMGKIEDVKNTMNLMERMVDEIGDKEAKSLLLENRATLYYYNGDYENAKKYLTAAIEILESLDDNERLSTLYTNMGILLGEEGNLNLAINFFKKSSEMDEKYRNIYGLAQDYTNLGIACHRKGDLKDAIKFLRKARDIYEKFGTMNSLGVAYLNIGIVLMDRGEFDESLMNLKRAREIFQKNGDMWGICHSYYSMGELMLYRHLYSESLKYLNKSIELAKKIQNKECLIDSYLSLLRVYIERREKNMAVKVSGEIEELRKEIDNLSLRVKINQTLGILKILLGDYEEGIEILRSSYKNFRRIGERINMAISLYYLGIAQIKNGDREDGKKSIERAMRISTQKNMKYWINKCKKIILDK